MGKPGFGARLASAIIWALTVGLFAIAFALQDVLTAASPSTSAIFGTAVLGACHALGGAIAGYLLAGLFGRAGFGGWALTLLGTVVVVLLGGLFGGALAALYGVVTGTSDVATDFIRIGLGAITAPLAIAESKWLGLVWIASGLVAHLTCKEMRV